LIIPSLADFIVHSSKRICLLSLFQSRVNMSMLVHVSIYCHLDVYWWIRLYISLPRLSDFVSYTVNI